MRVITDETGPLAYYNWKMALEGASSQVAYEYPLFTDAHITGELANGYGPYQVLNTCPDLPNRPWRPPLVLRAEFYLTYEQINRDTIETDDTRYHGGTFQDEIGALVSLCLGIRLKAGGTSRLFERQRDHRGRPVAWLSDEDPIVPPVAYKPVIPSALGMHGLDKAAPLANLPRLTPQAAIALVRAARMYQEGLWIAETQPAFTWLMFVSALETAASYWSPSKESPIERLRASRPDLEVLLTPYGGEELVQKVAEEIAPYMGATNKFINFVLTFLLEPPESRPEAIFQHPWMPQDIKKSMSRIYKYRSDALHGGTPFPAPMCLPALSGGTNAFMEKLSGGAMGVRGSVWSTKDIPMYLHTFEHITRGALLNWWKSLA